jgi:hypothetical protein
MMSCSIFQKLIPLYAGGELPPGKRSRVGGHLQGCERCREEAAMYAALRAAALGSFSADAVESQEHSIGIARREAVNRHMKELQAAESKPFFLRPSFSAAAAAVFTVILVGVFFFNTNFRHESSKVELGCAYASEVNFRTIPSREGAVLVWDNGEDSEYRILKSDSPRSFDDSRAVAVCGNRWVDKENAPGKVIYYKVVRTGKGCSS